MFTPDVHDCSAGCFNHTLLIVLRIANFAMTLENCRLGALATYLQISMWL